MLVTRKLRNGKRRFYKVNPNGKKVLLDKIAKNDLLGKPLTLKELIEEFEFMRSYLNYNTFYGRIIKLVRAGWVKRVKEGRFIKYVKTEKLTNRNVKDYLDLIEGRNKPRVIEKIRERGIPVEKRITKTEEIVRW